MIAIIGGKSVPEGNRCPKPLSISASNIIGTFERFCISFMNAKELEPSPDHRWIPPIPSPDTSLVISSHFSGVMLSYLRCIRYIIIWAIFSLRDSFFSTLLGQFFDDLGTLAHPPIKTKKERNNHRNNCFLQ